MNKVINLYIILLFVITALFISLNFLYNKNKQIIKYKEYYNATETLLDSLGLDCDDPIFESDEGAIYLDKKWEIDHLQ